MAGQVFIVTGAIGNLGRAVAAHLGAQGACVVAVDRVRIDPGIYGAELPPDRILALGDSDLGNPENCSEIVRRTLDRFGRLDGVAATVGGFATATASDTDPTLWQRMFEMNVITTVNVFRAALPALPQGGGSLVAVGAAAAVKAGSGMSAYAGTKAAMMRMIESFADEFRPTGLRVNAVLPGTIDTPQIRAALPDVDPKLWVKPAELASVIGFLLSPASSGVTGALIPVTGRG